VTSDANALVDTGFLVALCDRRDQHHAWAAGVAAKLRGPWLTCEACICEIDHLLDFLTPPQSHWIYELLASGAVQSLHLLPEHLAKVQSEIARYRHRRVDFADACLVVVSDELSALPVVTTDAAEFAVYFRGRGRRKLIVPSR